MKRDIIFSNAIARYNDSKLLKKEQFLRLVSASDYSEAVKMLYEHGYAKSHSQDPDTLIGTQIDALNHYAQEECPSSELLEILLNPFLYSNAKYYYKCANSNQTDDDEVFILSDANIKEAIVCKNYDELPVEMRDCALKLDKKFTGGKIDGKIIDIEFTAAMYRAGLRAARRSFRFELVKFVRAQIDLNNFVTFLRCRNLQKDWDFCAAMLVEGGKTEIEDFAVCYGENIEEVKNSLSHSEYFEIFEAMINGKINIDLGIDAALIKLCSAKENEYTSLWPFLSYYYKQLTEYKAMRMTLILIKNNQKSEIDKRLRSIYE